MNFFSAFNMRILFFITKSEAGGAQTHVAQLAKFFVSRGDEVAIMSAPGGWLEQEATKIGAGFYPNPFLCNTSNPLRLWRASKTLSRAINNFQPDIVACHSTIAGLIGRLSIRNRVPTIFTAHGWGFTQGAPLSRRIITPILERFAARYCDNVIVVSRNDLDLAHDNRITNDSKLTLIHNGVEPCAQRATTAHDTTNIFFVGRLTPPKDPILLINAIAGLPEELRKQIKLTIIGDGSQVDDVRDCIRDNDLIAQIEMTGTLTRDEVLKRLQTQADVFALVSRWEGFPYTILEAMALGIPVIASDVGGINEVVDDSVGCLISRDDSQALADAIQNAILYPDEWKTKGQRAYNRIHSNFSLQQMFEKTLSVYQNALRKRNKD
jgi:glycosyltransferase involved in cell wall biosynthesis